MADLEAVARWCDEFAKESKEAMLADDAVNLRAAAAACRELAANRAWEREYFHLDDGEHVITSKAIATDTALAEIE